MYVNTKELTAWLCTRALVLSINVCMMQMFPTIIGDQTDIKKWMADMIVRSCSLHCNQAVLINLSEHLLFCRLNWNGSKRKWQTCYQKKASCVSKWNWNRKTITTHQTTVSSSHNCTITPFAWGFEWGSMKPDSACTVKMNGIKQPNFVIWVGTFLWSLQLIIRWHCFNHTFN